MNTLWWQSRTMREKILIRVGLAAALLIFFFLWILHPLNQAITTSRETLSSQQALLHWMQAADRRILQLRQAGYHIQTATHSAPPLIVIEQTLSAAKLNSYLQQVKDEEKQTVLIFHEVPFDALMQWIEKLSHQNNIHVQQLTAHKTDHVGTAEVTVTLN